MKGLTDPSALNPFFFKPNSKPKHFRVNKRPRVIVSEFKFKRHF